MDQDGGEMNSGNGAGSMNVDDAFLAAVELHRAGRLDEALAGYQRVFGHAADHGDALYNAGLIYKARGAFEEALGLWRRASALSETKLNPQIAMGRLLVEMGRLEEAQACLDRALKARPDSVDALNLRGALAHRKGRLGEALGFFDAAIALKPDFALALAGRGDVLSKLGELEAAIESYRSGIAADPTNAPPFGSKLYRQLQICDWSDFDEARTTVQLRLGRGEPAALPFVAFAFSNSGAEQLNCARIHRRLRLPRSLQPLWTGETYRHDRIRVGYVSPDFRNHATAALIAGLFEQHDSQRFQIFGYALAPASDDAMRNRIQAAIPDFHDVANLGEDQIARLIRAHEIDILIDLGGYSDNALPGVFARRCAPIQINYLTYPGTLGGTFMDYILADRHVIPPGSERFYDEKVIRLPNSYQVNSRVAEPPGLPLRRADAGLPEEAVVFCCFNASYKITPEVFDVWMRLLSRVEGSVLWLLDLFEPVSRNLRAEAQKRGVDPARLVFAPKVGHRSHMARHRLADLFLDTLPCNAHTTASDALHMGLPLVTCAGEPFAARVAASVLCAVGLPELVTESLEAYEALAADLALNPDRLARVKAELQARIRSAPLFDTALTTRHIEAAYLEAWLRQQRGEPPNHFEVDPRHDQVFRQ